MNKHFGRPDICQYQALITQGYIKLHSHPGGLHSSVKERDLKASHCNPVGCDYNKFNPRDRQAA